MANVLISGITEQTTAPAASDWIEIETSAGVSKKVKISTLFAYRSNVGRFGMGFSVPSTALALDGSTVSRTTYADLWTYVNANYSPISLASWNAGAVGNFSVGNGSTTFGLPDFRGLFPRFAGTNSVMTLADAVTYFNGGNVFSVANDKMQTITGTLTSPYTSAGFMRAGYSISGAFTVGATQTNLPTFQSGTGYSIEFSSANSPNARTGGETSPARVSLIPYVYYSD